jgi:hypothetical protein
MSNLPHPISRPNWGDGGRADHWKTYLAGGRAPSAGLPFRLSVDELCKRAAFDLVTDELNRNGSKAPSVFVSDFSDWVFRLYETGPLQWQLEYGKQVERWVDTLAVRRHLDVFLDTGWELYYRDPLDGTGEALCISSLTIAGEAMRGRPDIVFRNRRTGDLIIVERKASQWPMPSDSWPNARAQVWCYSRADLFSYIDAPRVTLVVEAWRQSPERAIAFNGIATWDSQDAGLNRDMQRLFDIYRRQFE